MLKVNIMNFWIKFIYRNIAIRFFLVVIFLYFLKIFYNSFVNGADIYILSFKSSVIDTVLIFYFFCIAFCYFFIRKFFTIKKENLLYFLLISISLLLIGEYFFVIFFMPVFLISIFEFKNIFLKKILFLVYMYGVNYALILLFASTSYILYFLNLSAFLYILRKQKYNFLDIVVFLFVITTITLILNLTTFKEFLYEIYIWLDVVDKVNYVNIEILFILSFLHVCLMLWNNLKSREVKIS